MIRNAVLPPLQLVIPGDPMADLSPNLRLHPQERGRRVRAWRTKTWLVWASAGRVVFGGPARVQFTLRRGRAVDPDNAAASCKSLLDGLTRDRRHPEREACLVDDGAAHVALLPVLLEIGPQWKGRGAEVLVRVEELPVARLQTSPYQPDTQPIGVDLVLPDEVS